MESGFIKDYGTYCFESKGASKEVIKIEGEMLLITLSFPDVNTAYLVVQIHVMTLDGIEDMLISIDFINRIDLYTKLVDELDQRKIINKDKVLSAIMFQPISIDFEKNNIITIANMIIYGVLGDMTVSDTSGEAYYPIIATNIEFIE